MAGYQGYSMSNNAVQAYKQVCETIEGNFGEGQGIR